MSTRLSVFQREARRRWGKRATWIQGDGRWATLARCRSFTIELHQTIEDAQKALARINYTGCGGHCSNNHSLVDLATKTGGASMAGYLMTPGGKVLPIPKAETLYDPNRRGFIMIDVDRRGIIGAGKDMLFFGSVKVAQAWASYAKIYNTELIPATCSAVDGLADSMDVGWFELDFAEQIL